MGMGMGMGVGLGSRVWECGRCGVPSVWSKVNKKQAAEQELYRLYPRARAKEQPANANKMFAVRRLICLYSIDDDDVGKDDRLHSGSKRTNRRINMVIVYVNNKHMP